MKKRKIRIVGGILIVINRRIHRFMGGVRVGGGPDRYYREALRLFAYCLNYTQDKKKAELLSQEESCNVLEKEIMRWKNKLRTKDFYYQAGRTTEHVLNNVDANGGAMNLMHAWADCTILKVLSKLLTRKIDNRF